MPIRPLAPMNLQELTSVDDALAMIDANIEDLITMSCGTGSMSKTDVWTFDKNVLYLKGYYDRLEDLVRGENKR